MDNICGVTRHLREKILAAGGDPARETLNVIPTLSGAACHLDAEGGAWRAYDCVEDTICLQQVGSEADFRTVAETLGKIPEPAGRLSGVYPSRNHCPLPRHTQPLCKL